MQYVKSVQMQRFSWSVFSRIQSAYAKIWTRKNSVFGHFSRSVVYVLNGRSLMENTVQVAAWSKRILNPLNTNPTRWSNTLKQFVRNYRRIADECIWLFCGVGALGIKLRLSDFLQWEKESNLFAWIHLNFKWKLEIIPNNKFLFTLFKCSYCTM